MKNRWIGIAAGLALLTLSACHPVRFIDQSLTLGDLHAAGNAAFARGDFEESARLYGAYIERRPQEAEVEYMLGKSLLALGQSGQAREHLEIAYDLVPYDNRYVEALAQSILGSGTADELYAFLQEVAEGTMSVEGYITLGQYARQAGFIDESKAALMQAVAIAGKTSPEPYRALAEFYRSVNDEASEVDSLRVVLGFDHDDALASARLRDLGQVPGPTFALEPDAID